MRPLFARSFAAIFLSLSLIFVSIGVPLALFTEQSRPVVQAAQAGHLGLFCGGPDWLGQNMGIGGRWDKGEDEFVLGHLPRSRWTLQEAYGNNLGLPSYAGEGGRDRIFVVDTDPEASDPDGKDTRLYKGLKDQLKLDDEQTKKLYGKIRPDAEKLRSIFTCTIGSVNAAIGSWLLSWSNVLVKIVQKVVGFAVNPNFICPVDGPKPSGCFDLVNFVQGSGRHANDQGVIGFLWRFFSTFSVLLAALGLLLAVVRFAKTGSVFELAKGFLTTVLVVVASYMMFSISPSVSILVPRIAQTSAAVVVNVLQGRNADGTPLDSVGDGQTGESTSIRHACDVSVSNTPINTESINLADLQSGVYDNTYNGANGLVTAMHSASCSLWKATVLDPFARSTFGVGLNELDTMVEGTLANNLLNGKDANGKPVDGAPKIDPTLFCVPVGGSGPMDQFKNKPLKLSESKRICNVAAYQLYLGTQTSDLKEMGVVEIVDHNYGYEGEESLHRHYVDGPEVNPWWRIVGFAGLNETIWGTWKPSSSVTFDKINMGITSILITILTGWVIMFMAILGAMNYIQIFVIFMLWPLFFLLWIAFSYKDTVGKWLGWYGNSAVAYFMSILFLGLLVTFYEGIIASSSSLSLTFLLIIAMSIGMWMLRREILEIAQGLHAFGHVKNRANEFMNKVEAGARKKAKTATVKTAVGAAKMQKRMLRRKAPIANPNIKVFDSAPSGAMLVSSPPPPENENTEGTKSSVGGKGNARGRSGRKKEEEAKSGLPTPDTDKNTSGSNGDDPQNADDKTSDKKRKRNHNNPSKSDGSVGGANKGTQTSAPDEATQPGGTKPLTARQRRKMQYQEEVTKSGQPSPPPSQEQEVTPQAKVIVNPRKPVEGEPQPVHEDAKPAPSSSGKDPLSERQIEEAKAQEAREIRSEQREKARSVRAGRRKMAEKIAKVKEEATNGQPPNTASTPKPTDPPVATQQTHQGPPQTGGRSGSKQVIAEVIQSNVTPSTTPGAGETGTKKLKAKLLTPPPIFRSPTQEERARAAKIRESLLEQPERSEEDTA